MPGARDDHFLRTIREVAGAVGRIRGRLGGDAPADELMAAVRAAEGTLLGGRGALLGVLDARTAAQLLGTDAARLWVELLRLEGEVHRRGGREEAARAAELRAAELARQLPHDGTAGASPT